MAISLSKKFEALDEVQLRGMINYAGLTYPYLSYTSEDVLAFLAQLMIDVEFMSEKKATPIRSSLEFLRIAATKAFAEMAKAGVTPPAMFDERDFVFAIKMFGLYIRNNNGIHQFVPEDERDRADDVVTIDDAEGAKRLAYDVSDIRKRTKIQTNAIQSATNRLLRDWREIELARLFSERVNKHNISIGEAKKWLEEECGIRDHEFVRIREHAVARKWFVSKRQSSKANRRITLDEDVADFVDELTNTLAKGAKVLSMSQAANKALRDFHKMARGTTLASKTVESDSSANVAGSSKVKSAKK